MVSLCVEFLCNLCLDITCICSPSTSSSQDKSLCLVYISKWYGTRGMVLQGERFGVECTIFTLFLGV